MESMGETFVKADEEESQLQVGMESMGNTLAKADEEESQLQVAMESMGDTLAKDDKEESQLQLTDQLDPEQPVDVENNGEVIGLEEASTPSTEATKKPKVAKEPSARSSTSRQRQSFISADVIIGELDAGVAEHVKSNGIRRERKQVTLFQADGQKSKRSSSDNVPPKKKPKQSEPAADDSPSENAPPVKKTKQSEPAANDSPSENAPPKKKTKQSEPAADNSSENAPPKKKTKQSKPAADDSPSENAPPKKKTKQSKPAPDSERQGEGSGGSEEEILQKKKKKSGVRVPSLPSDSALRKVVVEVVKTTDLKQVTMKMMLETIYSRFPDVDLVPKKDFIKDVVRNHL